MNTLCVCCSFFLKKRTKNLRTNDPGRTGNTTSRLFKPCARFQKNMRQAKKIVGDVICNDGKHLLKWGFYDKKIAVT